MGTVALYTDLRAGVVDALRLLAESAAGQAVIRIGDTACEVDWSPGTYHHHALLLPLVLLTAAIDEGAAQARWQGVGFARVIDTAPQLDLGEKAMLRALASTHPSEDRTQGAAAGQGIATRQGTFAGELLAWIDRFDLEGRALAVDRKRLTSGTADAHYGVRPLALMAEMPAVLKPLAPEERLAAVAVLALYNGQDGNPGLVRQGSAMWGD